MQGDFSGIVKTTHFKKNGELPWYFNGRTIEALKHGENQEERLFQTRRLTYVVLELEMGKTYQGESNK